MLFIKSGLAFLIYHFVAKTFALYPIVQISLKKKTVLNSFETVEWTLNFLNNSTFS